MNGMIVPSVSAGSSQREASDTCVPHVRVPSGAAHRGGAQTKTRSASTTSAFMEVIGAVPSSHAVALTTHHTRPRVWSRARPPGCVPGKETPMVKIKHIAIRTPDPEKTAAFYKEVFGLKEVG